MIIRIKYAKIWNYYCSLLFSTFFFLFNFLVYWFNPSCSSTTYNSQLEFTWKQSKFPFSFTLYTLIISVKIQLKSFPLHRFLIETIFFTFKTRNPLAFSNHWDQFRARNPSIISLLSLFWTLFFSCSVLICFPCPETRQNPFLVDEILQLTNQVQRGNVQYIWVSAGWKSKIVQSMCTTHFAHGTLAENWLSSLSSLSFFTFAGFLVVLFSLSALPLAHFSLQRRTFSFRQKWKSSEQRVRTNEILCPVCLYYDAWTFEHKSSLSTSRDQNTDTVESFQCKKSELDCELNCLHILYYVGNNKKREWSDRMNCWWCHRPTTNFNRFQLDHHVQTFYVVLSSSGIEHAIKHTTHTILSDQLNEDVLIVSSTCDTRVYADIEKIENN